MKHPEPHIIDEPLYLVHHHPGYLRIQADIFRQTAEGSSVVTAAQAAAESVAGVRSWSQYPRTGSVVVQYDPGTLEADDLLKHIAKRAGLRGVEVVNRGRKNRQELVGALLDTVQGVNQVISQATDERADLRELVPVALAATSVVSFVLNEDRGRIPEWSGALYHSYRIFMQWHRKEARGREKAAREKEDNYSLDGTSGSA